MEIKNDGRLRICWMRIIGIAQFQDVFLDFTHPDTGEPLDKICLIGANGTGKTKVLSILFGLLNNIKRKGTKKNQVIQSALLIKFTDGTRNLISFFTTDFSGTLLLDKLPAKFLEPQSLSLQDFILSQPIYAAATPIDIKEPELFIFAKNDPLYAKKIEIGKVPTTTAEEALRTAKTNTNRFEITKYTVVEFWQILLKNLYERQWEFLQFLSQSKNQNKTVAEIKEVFDSKKPNLLLDLSKLWNRILTIAGLEFDPSLVEIPIDPSQNLKADIITKSTKTNIDYRGLSTGIRNYIFQIGHILAIHKEKSVQSGFLFVDEPEEGLFPDFLYDLIDVYHQATTDKNGKNNTQMFFATHEPIIAAQFEPHERVILEWNDDGSVRTRRGYSPIGDDPNDLLVQDFHVSNLMGKEGLDQWKLYIELRNQLRHAKDDAKKGELLKQILEIGNKYNFGPNEVSRQIN